MNILVLRGGGVTLKTLAEIQAMTQVEGYPWVETLDELNSSATAYYNTLNEGGNLEFTFSPAVIWEGYKIKGITSTSNGITYIIGYSTTTNKWTAVPMSMSYPEDPE